MVNGEEVLLGFFAVIAGVFFLFLLIMVLMYIFYGIGMFKIAKTLGRSDWAFLAWIPIAQVFLMPILIEEDVHESLRGKFTLIFAIVWISSFVLSLFFAIFGFLSLIIQIYAFHVLATRFSENALVHTIIAIVTLGISMPISLFLFRNRDPLPQQGVEVLD